eukprot:1152517-Pelagomonas_calceolata.AAC.1
MKEEEGGGGGGGRGGGSFWILDIAVFLLLSHERHSEWSAIYFGVSGSGFDTRSLTNWGLFKAAAGGQSTRSCPTVLASPYHFLWDKVLVATLCLRNCLLNLLFTYKQLICGLGAWTSWPRTFGGNVFLQLLQGKPHVLRLPG